MTHGLTQRLTLVCAPAGFGKTTLVGEWLATLDHAAAWLTLDPDDNDLVRFLTYLITALRRFDARIGQTLTDVLETPPLPPVETLATLLIGDLDNYTAPGVLALDDYHTIHNPLVHDFVTFWLEHKPPGCHVVILSRHDPPFPLARWRVRGELSEIRERDLRFTHAETTQFLNDSRQLGLSAESIDALHRRTEGWIASLHLAALSLPNHVDPPAFIANFAGTHRHIIDYLTDEVLGRLPAPLCDFLRRTSILDYFTVELCNAVTGNDDSQTHIQQLLQANLFVTPADDRRFWYRYHPMFAESLRAVLEPDEQVELHHRAAAWYAAQGLPEQAVTHALAEARWSGDFGRAEQLVATTADTMIHQSRLATVREWLAAFPEDYVRRSGPLAMVMGWVLALGGNLGAGDEYARSAEALFRRPEAQPADLGKTLVLRSTIATARYQAEDALAFAREGLGRLDHRHRYWQTIAQWCIGNAQQFTGHIADSIVSFERAIQLAEGPGLQLFTALTVSSLATARYLHGQRRQSLDGCNTALPRFTHTDGAIVPAAASLLARRGILHYEANDLAAAHHDLDQAVALSERSGLESQIILCLAQRTPVQFARGEQQAAIETLQALQQRARRSGYWDPTWFSAWEMAFRLRLGEREVASGWAATSGITLDEPFRFTRVEAYLSIGRILVACHPPERAVAWLDRLETLLTERGLNRWLITTHILQALARSYQGAQRQALDHLVRALTLASPEGFCRAFLDEDARVLSMLPAVRAVAPAFVDDLLSFTQLPAPRAQPLVEPLSSRELEVLALMADGLSNHDIAGRLFITPGTAKRHVHSILGKLDAANRTQAVIRAQELGIL